MKRARFWPLALIGPLLLASAGCGLLAHLADSASKMAAGAPSPSAAERSLSAPSSAPPAPVSKTSTVSASPSPVFPRVVREAMAAVASQTRVPLEAPAWTGLSGLSATTRGQATAYSVSLFKCSVPLPVNNPQVGTGQWCGAMANVYGQFGGETIGTQTAPAVLQSLTGAFAVSSLPSGVTHQSVSLGNGITGEQYAGQAGAQFVQWQEGDWTLQVQGGSNPQAVAQQVVALLTQYRLPPRPGMLVAVVAPDGIHTVVAWEAASGQVVYSTGGYHNPASAIAMAAAMAAYSGGS
ncbi:MAG: hypothetical protein M0Z53_00570 [Thermaerobacter sp.]|nr:hypothetical protein [Thermaerobacter sp.]